LKFVLDLRLLTHFAPLPK